MGLSSTRQRGSKQHGFTLIEALVALLVLSIGMLGVAAMQLKSLQGAHAAYQRSIASLAAQDAQERLWAAMANAGDMKCPSWSVAKDLGGKSWHDSWKGYLPELVKAAVSPAGTPNAGCEFYISVEWSDKRFGSEGDPMFDYTVRLPGTAP
ncbi:type IV pilus modification protein PilV [Halomonas sp. KAO]|nr:type IV pilus modification protein PilV [Halomonas sp. KAO]